MKSPIKRGEMRGCVVTFPRSPYGLGLGWRHQSHDARCSTINLLEGSPTKHFLECIWYVGSPPFSQCSSLDVCLCTDYSNPWPLQNSISCLQWAWTCSQHKVDATSSTTGSNLASTWHSVCETCIPHKLFVFFWMHLVDDLCHIHSRTSVSKNQPMSFELVKTSVKRCPPQMTQKSQ